MEARAIESLLNEASGPTVLTSIRFHELPNGNYTLKWIKAFVNEKNGRRFRSIRVILEGDGEEKIKYATYLPSKITLNDDQIQTLANSSVTVLKHDDGMLTWTVQ